MAPLVKAFVSQLDFDASNPYRNFIHSHDMDASLVCTHIHLKK